jgi:hypothetical protein
MSTHDGTREEDQDGRIRSENSNNKRYESGIRCLFTPLDLVWVKNQDPDPG